MSIVTLDVVFLRLIMTRSGNGIAWL